MNTFETNDWLVLNNIIYKIYTTEDFDAMRSGFIEQIKLMLDFDSADFFLADKTKNYSLYRPVTYKCSKNFCIDYDKQDYSGAIMRSGKSMVYRETDIMSDEHRVNTEYYKNVYVPNGWHYSLQIVIAYNDEFLGVITLYRTIGKDNFKYDDIFLMDMLKEHLAFRLYKERVKDESNKDKINVNEAIEKYALTKRETEILNLLLDGCENEEISDILVITVNTLKKHILNIYKKLGINSRIQLFKMFK